MTVPVTVWWIRQDLRLRDNPALDAAAARGRLVPLYVWSPREDDWAPGGATRWWLHHALADLRAQLKQKGGDLLLCQGTTLQILEQVIRLTGATAVYWNRRYEPTAFAGDQRVKQALKSQGVEAKSFKGSLLWEPWELQTLKGGAYRVFSPFWRACQNAQPPEKPLDEPRVWRWPESWPAGVDLDDLRLLPGVDWAAGMRQTWPVSERGAHEQLSRFLDTAAMNYLAMRDRPGQSGTSRLSAYLRFGQVSPRQVWHACLHRVSRTRQVGGEPAAQGLWGFLRQVGWREFAHHLLYHFPHTIQQPMYEKYQAFPWRDDPQGLRQWQRGQTGFPIVDAGMRELWHTGWMHNRVRMVVGSFLVKDLMLPWIEGARWFWDTLVDADLANNTLGWQWVAGCGADAAPYFRIFNPVKQGETFDPEGAYVRRWVPELQRLPAKWIHKPWQAPASALSLAGVSLGGNYPEPIVDHGQARLRALEALAQCSL